MTEITCTGCGHMKPLHDFMGSGAKGAIKQYRTCAICRARTTQKKNPKKRPLEPENNEVIEVLDLYDYTIQLLNMHTMQMTNKEIWYHFILNVK